MKKLLVLSLISLFACNAHVFSIENMEESVDSWMEYKYPELHFMIKEELINFEEQMVDKYAELLKEKIKMDNKQDKIDKSLLDTKEYKNAVEQKIHEIICCSTINYKIAEEYVDRVNNRNDF